MNLLIITGSHRENSQSIRVAKVLKEKYLDHFDSCKVHELASMDLPLWDMGIWKGEEKWKKILAPLHEDINNADAFLIVTPEWSGMAPPMLKNYFLLSNQSIMGHKPALIVSVSSGLGGSYPVAELRISSYKNTKICYIPEHIILRNVEKLFNGEDADHADLLERIKFACGLLFEYAKALKPIRTLPFSFDKFPYGM